MEAVFLFFTGLLLILLETDWYNELWEHQLTQSISEMCAYKFEVCLMHITVTVL